MKVIQGKVIPFIFEQACNSQSYASLKLQPTVSRTGVKRRATNIANENHHNFFTLEKRMDWEQYHCKNVDEKKDLMIIMICGSYELKWQSRNKQDGQKVRHGWGVPC